MPFTYLYTAIIQPMDQNLIQNIKVSYQKSLLAHIISQADGYIVKLLQSFSSKDAILHLDEAWQSLSGKNIQQNWSALWTNLISEWEKKMTFHFEKIYRL